MPGKMKHDIELYRKRRTETSGQAFTAADFQRRCGLSREVIAKAASGTGRLSVAAIKRINSVVHNNEDFTDVPLRRRSPSPCGPLAEVPAWVVVKIRSHLDTYRHDKDAEKDVEVFGGNLRKIADGRRVFVRTTTLKKLVDFYNRYDERRAQRDLPEVARATRRYRSEDESSPESAPAKTGKDEGNERNVLASVAEIRLIDAFERLEEDERNVLATVAEMLQTASGRAEEAEWKVEATNGRMAEAETNRDHREKGLLDEIERLRSLADGNKAAERTASLEKQVAEWKEKYTGLHNKLELLVGP